MALFKNKYRIESTRLKGWNYSTSGVYFVTMVTKNRVCYFGNVENGDMHLNELGEIAKQKSLKGQAGISINIGLVF